MLLSFKRLDCVSSAGNHDIFKTFKYCTSRCYSKFVLLGFTAPKLFLSFKHFLHKFHFIQTFHVNANHPHYEYETFLLVYSIPRK